MLEFLYGQKKKQKEKEDYNICFIRTYSYCDRSWSFHLYNHSEQYG